MPPTLANGKICYLEIPATDVAHSADFYNKAFGWQIRQRADGHTAFDDGCGEVSGAWTTIRKPASEPGLLLYIMVENLAATVSAIEALGCEIVQPMVPGAKEMIATFRDPGGNIIGIYQDPALGTQHAEQ